MLYIYQDRECQYAFFVNKYQRSQNDIGPVRPAEPGWVNLSPAYLRNGVSVLAARVPLERKKQLPDLTDQSENWLKFQMKFSCYTTP